MRKNISVAPSDLDAADKLAEDEEIVISDVRTIHKGRRKPDPEPAEPEPDTDLNFIDIDDDGDPVGDDAFPPESVGDHILNGQTNATAFDGSVQCNIVVIRKPDGLGDRFVKPCDGRMKEPPIRNIDLSTSKGDIEEIVRKYYWGGHYYLQPQTGTMFHKGWDCSLTDPDAARRSLVADPVDTVVPAAALPPSVAQPVVNPIDAFLDSIEKQQRMKTLIFGEQEERYKEDIAELRHELEQARREPSEPKSEKLSMLETALAAPNTDMQTRLLNHLFPVEETGSRHWIADLADVALQNKDVIMSLVGSLLGGVTPAPQPQPTNAFEDMMRQPPPGELPNIPATPSVPTSGIFGPRPDKPPVEIDVDGFLAGSPPPESVPGAVEAEAFPPDGFDVGVPIFATTGAAADERTLADPDQEGELIEDDANAIDAEFTEEPKAADAKPKRSKNAGA